MPNSIDDGALKSQPPAMPLPTAHSPKIGEYRKLWVEYMISILKLYLFFTISVKKKVCITVCVIVLIP